MLAGVLAVKDDYYTLYEGRCLFLNHLSVTPSLQHLCFTVMLRVRDMQYDIENFDTLECVLLRVHGGFTASGNFTF